MPLVPVLIMVTAAAHSSISRKAYSLLLSIAVVLRCLHWAQSKQSHTACDVITYKFKVDTTTVTIKQLWHLL